MNLRPLHDNVLVRPDKPEETTESGIVLLKKQSKVTTGTVLAIGAGKPHKGSIIPVGVKVGEKIAYQGVLAETQDGNHLINQGQIWWVVDNG